MEYRSIIVVNENIYKKIELYRQILEKSEFNSCLDRALFTPDSSVEAIPSTELNVVENFVYLYSEINKKQYKTYLEHIKEKSRKYQNANYYMLFCRDRYQEEAYDNSPPPDKTASNVFSIGILNDEVNCDDENGELSQSLNALKLIVLAMAICKFNETHTTASFESTYMCADIELDYVDIFYAIMHTLCADADLINEKERKILMNNEQISAIQARKDSICEGKFTQSETAKIGLKSKFSDYKNAETLQREMEFSYKLADEALNKEITGNIDTARCALAVEEENTDEMVATIHDEHIEFETTSNSAYFQKYMNITVVTDDEQASLVAQPEDLLKKPVEDISIDSIQLKALLPLAREFDRHKNSKPWFIILTAAAIALIFLVLCSAIYYIRYKFSGLNGVTNQDFINVLAIPAVTLLLSGITGLIIQLIRFLFSRAIFKKAYKLLRKFISESTSFSENIRKYINKYLTVYYNHHIKHSRIKNLMEDNIVLSREIDEIRANVSPINAEADTICQLNGETIEISSITINKNSGPDDLSMRRHLEQHISTDTEILCNDQSIRTVTPWAKRIAYSPGNMNCGGER